MQAPPEQLGSFYLGAEYDLEAGARKEAAVNYDARDLVTHAVCVGMTGSGKTGLCLGLLEEAALDKVPAILIDPKGDITNLLLQFPNLQPSDFQPWINEDDARRKDKTVEDFAAATADQWKNGLADWGINGERMKLLASNTSYTIFTPGSDMGIPINILGSLAAPKLDWATEAESIRERITGTVAALLGLAGINADPVRSREGILLANIFENAWQAGQDLDLAKLITAIQKPPFRQLGVFDVDTFYPEKDRFNLAMAFNTLVASPKFQTWLQGEPLDVDRLFFDAEGKPRHSVIYIAHLSDSERMFIVTLILENLVTWMRRQSGTTSLRALFYFDEIFGYFPPTAEPPSKRPLLTLFKQARAFGLGCVVVTQNPVDLDYKGLTNAGTWFIGKLQAERDKERVLSGLKGALSEAGQDSEVNYDKLITRLGNRVFLMHNVHDDGPMVFTTRWAMSYLRGPLTLPQVRDLMAERKAKMKPAAPVAAPVPVTAPAPAPAAPVAEAQPPASAPAPAVPAAAPAPAAAIPAGFSTMPPAVEPAVVPRYLPISFDERSAARHLAAEIGGQAAIKSIHLLYEAGVLGEATVRFADPKRRVDTRLDIMRLARPDDSPAGVDWGRAESVPMDSRKLLARAESATQDPYFAAIPAGAASGKKLNAASKELADWLYYNQVLKIEVQPELGIARDPEEDTRQFSIRVQQAAREQRDAEIDKLRNQYAKQIDTLADKLTRAQQSLNAAQAKAQAKQTEQWVNIGESILGVFMGKSSRRAVSSATSKWNQASQAANSVEETKQTITELQAEKQQLEEELAAKVQEITTRWDGAQSALVHEELKPRRGDVDVQTVTLGWAPFWHITYDDGGRERTATLPAYALPEVG
jgi:hypothetical protein